MARDRLNLTAAGRALMVETIRQGLERTLYEPNLIEPASDHMVTRINGDLVFWHGRLFECPVLLAWYAGEDLLR